MPDLIRGFMRACLASATLLGLGQAAIGAEPAQPPRPPNVIFILADDLARGDLGSYGQQLIKTPNLDRMAAEGMRCTQAYSGTSVCAPSRASLMTGLHMGHCPVRSNRELQGMEGQMPLPAGTVTVASVLKAAGYATACVGKWGMGRFDSSGSPFKLGFDRFYGYNCQRQAHSYFPKYVYDDEKRVDLDGKTYVQDLFQRESLAWVRANKDRPFLLYYAVTLPHQKLEIDDLGAYAATDWKPNLKAYAAMVSRLDRDTGQLLDLLKELQIDDDTLVILAGDNGSSFAPDSELGRHFAQAQGLRGYKRSMYEGGLRQAALIRWPGVVRPGTVGDQAWAFWDVLPTVAELAGTRLPDGFTPDGVSLVPMLRGGTLAGRDRLYWELHEGGFRQAVRFGDWKAVRNGAKAPLELYDLATDPGETKNLAAAQPATVAKAEALLAASRSEDPNWPIK